MRWRTVQFSTRDLMKHDRFNLTLIAAHDRKGGIGINGTLPWKFPGDLKFFKEVTEGGIVIMGKKTFDSIGRPLSNRRNVVMSRTKKFHLGASTVASLWDAMSLVGAEPVFIIGGAQLYQQTMVLADRMILTTIDNEYRCDTFFPEYGPGEWEQTEVICPEGMPYQHRTFIRKGRTWNNT